MSERDSYYVLVVSWLDLNSSNLNVFPFPYLPCWLLYQNLSIGNVGIGWKRGDEDDTLFEITKHLLKSGKSSGIHESWFLDKVHGGSHLLTIVSSFFFGK